MKLLKYATLLISFIAILLSCKEDDPAPTKTDLLTAKPWQFTEVKLNGVDLFLLYDACEKDNIVTFYKEGTLKYESGTTKCDPSETPQAGIWSFKENETILEIDDISYTLDELTSAILKLSGTEEFDGNIVTISITLKPQ